MQIMLVAEQSNCFHTDSVEIFTLNFSSKTLSALSKCFLIQKTANHVSGVLYQYQYCSLNQITTSGSMSSSYLVTCYYYPAATL